jgi:K+-transporting ATPase ATPase A chain
VNWQGYAQIVVLLALLVASVKPLGAYMARVYEGQPIVLQKALGWLERLIYRLSGVPNDPEKREMSWTTYAVAMLLFNGAGIVIVYALERLQGYLPLNPQDFGAPTPDLSWNTAVSFATNTNWQSYGGETTMSYLTQMLGLAVQNFVCAASGMAVMMALVRGIARKQTTAIGNFWVDLTRGTLYVLRALVCLAGGRPNVWRIPPRGAAASDEGRRRPRRDRSSHRTRAGRIANRNQDARHERRRFF